MRESESLLKRYGLAALLTAGALSGAIVAHRAGAQPAGNEQEVVVHIGAATGPQYDTVRFQVSPGARVRIVLENLDTMQHNLVIVKPGARIEIVDAAQRAAAQGATGDYVPASDKVLFHSQLLDPGSGTTLSFTAPRQEGIYPYVCTFPGHGYLMYGAMYVGGPKALPPVEKDPNVPPPGLVALVDPHAANLSGPRVQRTFLPDCGPAAIAVHVHGGLSYCFDAGQCRLRYAWKGGFVDRADALAGTGRDMPRLVGRVWWRERQAAAFPLRLGETVPGEDGTRAPAVQFHGYRLRDRLPEFHYAVDGTDVREYITAAPRGIGLVREFTLARVQRPVEFVADLDGGAVFSASAGTWSGPVLRLSVGEAQHFSVTMTERPGEEPLGYWSMNDVPAPGKGWNEPVPGVVGQALGFDGKRLQIDTGINVTTLKAGATLVAWAKPDVRDLTNGAIFGADAGKGEHFLVGFDCAGVNGFAVSLCACGRAIVGPQTRPLEAIRAEARPSQAPASARRDEHGAATQPSTQPRQVGGGAPSGIGSHPELWEIVATTGAVLPKLSDSTARGWHQVAVVVRIEGTSLFIDGRQVTMRPGPPLSGDGKLFVGSSGGAGYFHGLLDEARVYDRPLGPEQVRRLYERERPAEEGGR